jgi:hypothetical protein
MLNLTCHICGKLRPASQLGAFRDQAASRGSANGDNVVQAIRYCNDSPECLAGAKSYPALVRRHSRAGRKTMKHYARTACLLAMIIGPLALLLWRVRGTLAFLLRFN